MAAALCKHNIGSLLIMDQNDNLVGIVSERDLARALHKFPDDIAQRSVSEIMTRSVITCGLNDNVLETLNIMNENGIRHMPVLDEGRPIAVVSIREFDFACKRLKVLANTDELTGLSNRRHFLQCLEAEFSRFDRFNMPFCVVMLDLDKFKPINDNYGHDAGDQVLRTLSDIFRAGLREYDVVGRLGGEEFGIILPNTSPKNAVTACEHLAESIRAAEIVSDKGIIKFTASFGVAGVSEEAHDTASIMKEADKCLYEAKESGRDRIIAGSTAFPQNPDSDLEIERARA